MNTKAMLKPVCVLTLSASLATGGAPAGFEEAHLEVEAETAPPGFVRVTGTLRPYLRCEEGGEGEKTSWCGICNGSVVKRFVLVSDGPLSGGAGPILDAAFLEAPPDLDATRRGSASGLLVGRTLLVADWEEERAGNVAEPSETATTPSLPLDTSGPVVERVLVLCVDRVDNWPGAEFPFDPRLVRERVFESPDCLRSFVERSSLGRATLAGDVVGGIAVRYPGAGHFWAVSQAALAASKARGYDPARYRYVLMYLPFRSGGYGGTYLGGDPTGGRVLWFGINGYVNRSVPLLMHELGHLMTLRHAERGADPYGDPWDVMGGIWSYSLFNGPHRAQLGWLRPGEIAEVKGAGEHLLCSLDGPADGIRMLAIPGLRPDRPLYVCHRTGWEHGMAVPAATANTYIPYLSSPNLYGGRTYLKGWASSFPGFHVDAGNGVGLAFEEAGHGRVRVHVAFGGDCAGFRPILSPELPEVLARAGEEVVFPVRIANSNPFCESVAYRLEVADSLPHGWTASLDRQEIVVRGTMVERLYLKVRSPRSASSARSAAPDPGLFVRIRASRIDDPAVRAEAEVVCRIDMTPPSPPVLQGARVWAYDGERTWIQVVWSPGVDTHDPAPSHWILVNGRKVVETAPRAGVQVKLFSIEGVNPVRFVCIRAVDAAGNVSPPSLPVLVRSR